MMILPIVPKTQWRTPSLSQPKDMFGNENRTVFRIDARANDGGLVWRGWFDDRDDADAFLYAAILGTLKNERALWDLPTPNWQPYLGELITYEFATLSFLSVTGTNLTYTFPSDWNNGDNSMETIGAGGSGGTYTNSTATNTGGGGGGYSKITNYTKPGATTSYTIGAGGVGKNSGGSFAIAGAAGGDVYFGSTSLATSSVGSKGGSGGNAGGGGQAGASGGAAASGVGTTKYSGGNSGSTVASNFSAQTGGGGAAGPYGAGGASASLTTSSGGTTNGGNGGNGFGGAGSAVFAPGGNGTEFDATHGSGGGGGASNNTGNHGQGGGNYGGGGGAAGGGGGTYVTDAGASGLIVITYSPLIGGLFGGGRSALGMG